MADWRCDGEDVVLCGMCCYCCVFVVMCGRCDVVVHGGIYGGSDEDGRLHGDCVPRARRWWLCVVCCHGYDVVDVVMLYVDVLCVVRRAD